MSSKVSIPTPTIIAALASFLGGGFMGAIFTWYMNRPDPTIIIYRTYSATLASSDAKSLIPELKVHVNNEPVTTLFSHSLHFTVESGPHVEKANIALIFQEPVTIYGFSATSPSPVQPLGCTKIPGGLNCVFGPLAPRLDTYRVAIATNQATAPRALVAVKNVELMDDDSFERKYGSGWRSLITIKTAVVVAVFVLYGLLGLLVYRALRRRIIVTGKILDHTGAPVEGAQVEVIVDSEDMRFPPTLTDSSGDFIIGRLTKRAKFTGRMRIHRHGVESEEAALTSPIAVHILKKP